MGTQLRDPKAEILAAEYLIDFDVALAAARAQISEEEARQILARPATKARLREMARDVASAVGVSVGYVLETIKDTVERCRQAKPVLDDEGTPTGEYKFDAASTLKGCELLGKHLRMFVDRTEVEHKVTLEALILQSLQIDQPLPTQPYPQPHLQPHTQPAPLTLEHRPAQAPTLDDLLA